MRRVTPAIATTALVVTVLGVAPVATADPAGAVGILAFSRDNSVFTVLPDGSAEKRLTKGATPAWSPDGRRIAFHRYVRGTNAEIFVADADGQNERRVTRHPAEDLWAAWSPDGKRLAFVSARSGAWEVHVMRADGTNVRRITHRRSRTELNVTPAWSPDGKLIAFSSTRTPENAEIYTVRPDGTGLRRLTRTKGDVDTLGDDGFPAFSPDGKQIVFSSNRTGDGEVWTMRADGSRQRRLVRIGRRDELSPEFSPDGAWIVFHSEALGHSELYRVRADGTGLQRIRVNGADPTWRP